MTAPCTLLSRRNLPMEESPASQSHATDWSNLPADILTTVFCDLEFPDLFSSAAVCASWRATVSALVGLGIYTRPQTPCLFYAAAAAAARAGELYSIAAGRSYTLPDLPDPPITERYIFRASHGWLVTADTCSELHLLNPATGEQVELPYITSVEHVATVLDGAGELARYDLSFYGTAIPRRETQPPQIRN